jgi:hypothetical protein
MEGAMKIVPYLVSVAVSLSAASPAAAGTIALGTITHSGFTSMQRSQWGAQVFTLTSPLELAAFELGLVHTTGFTSRVQLVQGGPPGSGTTLFDTTFSDDASPRLDFLYESYSFAAPMTLLPGTYYIVATNQNSQEFGWSFGTNQTPSTFGTIGAVYVCLDALSANGCNDADPKASLEWMPLTEVNLPLDFRLVEQEPETPTAVPEPATWTLVALGGVLGSTARRRVRRHTSQSAAAAQERAVSNGTSQSAAHRT